MARSIRRVYFRSKSEQIGCHRTTVIPSREVEGRCTLVVGRIDPGTLIEQRFGRGRRPLPRRNVKSRVSITIGRVDVCAVRQKHDKNFGTQVLPDRPMQRRHFLLGQNVLGGNISKEVFDIGRLRQGFVQRLPPRQSAPRSVAWLDRQSRIHDPRPPCIAGEATGQWCERHVERSFGSTGWPSASQDAISDCSQGIDVREGALSGLSRVLLDRSVAVRDDDSTRLFAYRDACRAKVDQYRALIGLPNDDIARRDVSMEIVPGVDVFQPVEKLVQPSAPSMEIQSTLGYQELRERCALDVVLNDDGRPMCLEVAANSNDVRVVELADDARFLEMSLVAPTEESVGVWRRSDPAVPLSRSVTVRKVLLECHGLVEVSVVGEIGDSEATFSEHSHDFVFLDAVAGWEGMR